MEEVSETASERAGEDEVGEADVLRLMPGVRALILRMTRDVALANDLTQDVMMGVIVAVREHRLRESLALKAYVHQSARHIVYAAQRKATPISDAGEMETEEAMWQAVPKTPLEYCEADEMRKMALDVLAELPAQRDRDLIVGFYVEGESKHDLMRRLNLTPEHFDRVIFRARTRMRDRLRIKMSERMP